ncbi:unnamed protein product [Prorocentrum cordatum]|uniref:Uncharacterized protein n=1 Tax=Prorocentrum cordatum TaxID=2364126 RepID=A0ABN9QVH8_9DINO|nr:unnamed protein product [Polarella glacialis]
MASVSVELNSNNSILRGALIDRTAPMETGMDVVPEVSGTQSSTQPRRQRSTSLRHAREVGETSASHTHRVPASQYVTIGVWMVLLFIEYGLVRLMCDLGVPPDHTADDDIIKVLSDFQFLLFAGFVLAILTGINWPDRFLYIFCFQTRQPRGYMFLAAFFLSGIGWGFLDLFPGLSEFSLTEINLAYAIPLLALLLGAIALIVMHLWMAYRHNSWSGFFAYFLSRCALFAFYSSYLVVKMQTQHKDSVVFHFHHYAVGFLAASLAEFNHPLSVLLLACGTGVFVQGIAAYDADPILAKPSYYVECFGVRSPLMRDEVAQFVTSHMRCRPHTSG